MYKDIQKCLKMGPRHISCAYVSVLIRPDHLCPQKWRKKDARGSPAQERATPVAELITPRICDLIAKNMYFLSSFWSQSPLAYAFWVLHFLYS